jgi:3D (Asp-Asp-Asp) domain-containing protein
MAPVHQSPARLFSLGLLTLGLLCGLVLQTGASRVPATADAAEALPVWPAADDAGAIALDDADLQPGEAFEGFIEIAQAEGDMPDADDAGATASTAQASGSASGSTDPEKAYPAKKLAIPATANGKKVYRVCRVTAYCDDGITASGRRSGVGQCAAPGYIPLGSRVYIPALKRTFVVTDRTHPRFRHNTVDIFIPSDARCIQFGRKYLECQFTLPADG